MPDFHHNVFYYYKGAAVSGADRDCQLEDNTTKALINVLEHCSPVVCEKFLSWIGIQPLGTVTCCLQRQTIGKGLIQLKKKRLLLGIVPSGPPSGETCAGSRQGVGSRPDGWIYGDDFVVLIESKVVGSLDASQVRRHLTTLAAEATIEPEIVVKTWPDVHRFFSTLDAQVAPKDAWLVQQFTKYLEWSNMSDFVGFEAEAFEFFYGPNDKDTRKWFRNTFNLFASSLLERLKRFDAFYEDFDIGNIKENVNHCWVAFGPGGGRYRKFAHQSVAITPFGVEVFFNVETSGAVRRLRNFINKYPGQFESTILQLANIQILSAIVVERTQKQVSLYDYAPVAQIEGDILYNQTLRENSFAYLKYLLNEISFPQFKLQVLFEKNSVIAEKGDIVEEVFAAMKKFHPLVSLVNGG